MALEKILFGTYTRRVSKGIYEAALNTETGELQDAKLVAEVGSPTYLALSKANKLYAVDKNGDQGGVGVFDFANDLAGLDLIAYSVLIFKGDENSGQEIANQLLASEANCNANNANACQERRDIYPECQQDVEAGDHYHYEGQN